VVLPKELNNFQLTRRANIRKKAKEFTNYDNATWTLQELTGAVAESAKNAKVTQCRLNKENDSDTDWR